MTATRRLAIVVLNWNGWADTLECLESLRPAISGGRVCVILVDNNSTNDSVARIRDWLTVNGNPSAEATEATIAERPRCPDFNYFLIHADKNRGYAGGNNLGIRFALLHTPCDYIFILNNDAIVERATIENLITWGDGHPEIALFAPTISEPDGTAVAGGARYNVVLTTSFPRRVGSSQADIDYVSGAAMVLRTDMVRKVGLLNDQYFLYYEELDYALRAKAAGFELGWCPEARVHHKKARSTNGVEERKSTLAEYHSNLSCLIFTAHFYRRFFFIAALFRMVSKAVYFSATGRLDLFAPLVRAYLDYFRDSEKR